MTPQQPIRIYIGAKIEYESERIAFNTVIEILTKQKRSAIILANISLHRRQLDLIVACEDLVLVIEAKGYTRPVRGGQNGPWQIQSVAGGWKETSNAYRQTLDAVYDLRDSMRSFTGTDVLYPSGLLLFVPRIPKSSSIDSSGFKISVISLDELEQALTQKSQSSWSLSQWQRFSEDNHLIPISTPDAAYDEQLLHAENVLTQYIATFAKTYSPTCANLVAPSFKNDGDASSLDTIFDLLSQEHKDILLEGPSGCGKSMAASKLALDFANGGGLSIVLPARDYAGNLKEILEREAGLLGAPSVIALFAIARRLNRSILVVVDGYNECVAAQRTSLTRSVSSLARKYDAKILVTSQITLERSDLMNLTKIEVLAPSVETKLAIARKAAGDQLTSEIIKLSHLVSSGLEAHLVGALGKHVSSFTGRYGLFDAFARVLLGPHASEGISTMAKIAGHMSDDITFSISVRELDRLAEAQSIKPEIISKLRAARLLVERADRVCFAHEMYLHAFSAEAIIRRAAGRAEPILNALADPRYHQSRELMVGSIDNTNLLEQVLSRVRDSHVIAACMAGICGQPALEWTKANSLRMWCRIGEEAKSVRFQLADEGWWNVAFNVDSLADWTDAERAFLDAVPELLDHADQLDALLNVVALMDECITREWNRLRDEAKQRNIRAMRGPMFGTTYMLQSPVAPGISRICSRLSSSNVSEEKRTGNLLKQKLESEKLSHGQIYVLLSLAQRLRETGLWIAPPLTRIIKQHWKAAPYHLRLELMQIASYCWRADDASRRELIEVIEPLLDEEHIFLNTSVIEALQSLGALTEDEERYEQDVIEQLNAIFDNPETEESCTKAYRVYSAQVDHPYSGAYYRVISELAEPYRKRLLILAAKGARDNEYASFISSLIAELTNLNDPSVSEIITHWTSLPPEDTGFIDEKFAAFLTAHIALGRLKCTLPEHRIDSPTASAVLACAHILYWMNRQDLPWLERSAACAPLMNVLNQPALGVAACAISQCENNFLFRELNNETDTEAVRKSIADTFPQEVAEICRQALNRPTAQIGYFKFSDKRKILEFALQIIGKYGNSIDLTLLKRTLGADPNLGTAAIVAIKALEERLLEMNK
jgi:hypothetical protein